MIEGLRWLRLRGVQGFGDQGPSKAGDLHIPFAHTPMPQKKPTAAHRPTLRKYLGRSQGLLLAGFEPSEKHGHDMLSLIAIPKGENEHISELKTRF